MTFDYEKLKTSHDGPMQFVLYVYNTVHMQSKKTVLQRRHKAREKYATHTRWDSIFKLLRSPGIDSKDSIPPRQRRQPFSFSVPSRHRLFYNSNIGERLAQWGAVVCILYVLWRAGMYTFLPLSHSFFSLWSKNTLVAHSPGGGGGGGEEGIWTKIRQRAPWLSFYRLFLIWKGLHMQKQRDCDESRCCISLDQSRHVHKKVELITSLSLPQFYFKLCKNATTTFAFDLAFRLISAYECVPNARAMASMGGRNSIHKIPFTQ